MQIADLTRDINHVHYRVLDDTGNEIRQVDRDLTDRELRVISRQHKSLDYVIAQSEGAEIVAKQRDKASSAVVVHAFEPHEHPYLSALPEHTHEEIKETEDYLTRRIKDAEDFIGRVQETLRGHSHEVPPHEHPDKPLPVHDHPHTHDDLRASLTSLEALCTRLSADLVLATTEHDHTAILARLMAVEGEGVTIQGLLAAHKHDHTHGEFGEIRAEMATAVHAQNAEITSLNSRLGAHSHPLPEHEHPHEHKDLKAGIERVEAKTQELAQADAEIIDRLGKVDATHRHADTDEAVTKLTTGLGAVERQLARHDHPHEHRDVVERMAKLDEKLVGHTHNEFAPKVHEHEHSHDEFDELRKLIGAVDVKVSALGRLVNEHGHDGRYLQTLPAHEHPGYLTELPAHDHPQYDSALEAHKQSVKESQQWRVLSSEETGGRRRLIVEEVI